MRKSVAIFCAVCLLTVSACSNSTPPDTSGNNDTGGNALVTLMFAGTEHGLYRSSDLGKSWQSTTGLTYYPGSLLSVNGRLLATVGLGGLYTSIDSGLTWTFDQTKDHFNGALASYKGLLLAGTGNGLLASSDDGQTWSVRDANTIPLSFATADGYLFGGAYQGVVRSTDGLTWEKLSSLHAESIVAHGSELFAAVLSNGAYHSTDDGVTWEQINAGLKYPYVRSISVSGNTLFLGTDDGLYSRDISGDTWTAIRLLTTTQNVEVRSVDAVNDYVIAGSPSHGIFLSSDAGKTWSRSKPSPSDSSVRFVRLWSVGN
jgi:hypothetical protein